MFATSICSLGPVRRPHPITARTPDSPECPAAEASSNLPPCKPCTSIAFRWGDAYGTELIAQVCRAYEEVVLWRQNVFYLPSGRDGTWFVNEKARLFEAMQPGNPIEPIAMKAAMIMEHLLLQRPRKKSKSKDHVCCLRDDREPYLCKISLRRKNSLCTTLSRLATDNGTHR